MARLIDIQGAGGPENEGERRVVQKLLDQLPDDGYWIAPNVEVTDQSNQTLEYDAIVVAPHAVYVLEVKDWWGHIEGDEVEWLVNGYSRRAPLRTTERKAKILKSKLVDRVQALSRVWVQAAVVLASDPTSLVLTPEGDRFVFRLDNIAQFIIDPAGVGQRASGIRDMENHIVQALSTQVRPRSGPLAFRDYEVIEQLDQSGDEALYRARHRLMPGAPPVRLRVVSLSPYVYTPEQLGERKAIIIRETEALLRMGSHPNVIAAREFFEDDHGHIILVIDDNDGRSLRQRLSTGTPMTVQERLDLLCSVCRALVHAHSHGVVHRLVEPRSIILGDDGVVRLGRFGMAKLINGAAHTVWHDPAEADVDMRYVAPELVNPTLGAAGPSTDLYGLGCVAHELFAGGPPFDAPNRAFEGAPPLPSDTRRELVELISCLLKGDPAQRPSNAKEVLAELQKMTPSEGGQQITGPKNEYQPGELIDGKFEVRSRLGGGGFSTVYRVYKPLDDREYALKVFNAPASYDKLKREIDILLMLPPHPHIVRVVWADQTMTGQWYLVTEFIDGEPLEAYAEGQKRLSPAGAVKVITELLSALEVIHPNARRIDELRAKMENSELTPDEYDEWQDLQRTGIVHRDIKPQNLLLTADGVKLIDFNISSRVGQPVQTMSGTPPYMPPGSTSGVEVWDVSPDLFATGVVLYQLICCEHPWENWQPIASHPPRDPHEFRPDISHEFAEFLTKACAPRREDRFATAQEMRSALEAIDSLLAPVAIGGATGLPQSLQRLIAAAPPNVNPMVAEFLALSSQARRTNKGTRGMDDLARATYVETRLDGDLGRSVREGKHRLVIVTGNAGDGKTAFIQQVEQSIKEAGADVILETSNGSRLRYKGLDIMTLYDGSQDESDRRSDDVLKSFLAPYSVAGTPDAVIRLAAINEGRLRDFLMLYRLEFPSLATDVLAALDAPEESSANRGVVIVNLNLRSVTAQGDESIFSRQLRKIVEGPFWEPCERCEYRVRCPVKHNVDTFRDGTSGTAVTERLRVLAELARLRRRRHLTMRDVRSLISHMLFRDRYCEELHRIMDSDEPFDILDLAYFQAPGGAGIPAGSVLERGAESLKQFDVALVANPSDDRALAYGHGLRRMEFPGRESEYPFELIQGVRERAGVGYDSDAHLARRVHEAARRQAYFERADDGWLNMLPYKRVRDFNKALHQSDSQARLALLAEVVKAVSVYEGVTNGGYADEALWLATSDEVVLDYRCFRRFPIEDFELNVANRDVPYVEAEPDRLELIHKPGGARLDLDLDLVEVLERLSEGDVPALDDGGGFLINLALFKNQLLAQPSTELFLIADDHLMRIGKGNSPGAITVSEVQQTP